jgi:RND family efflux transporter MFP subunit
MRLGRVPHVPFTVDNMQTSSQPPLLRVLRLTILGCALAPGCSSEGGGTAEPTQAVESSPLAAEVITIEPTQWPTYVRAQGSLVADEEAVIGARVEGRVSDVHVDLGDVVEAGAPLISLDDETFRLEVSQAEAQQAQARAAVGLKPDEDVEQLDPESSPPVREARALWDEASAQRRRLEQLRERDAVTEADLEQALAAEDVAAAQYESAVNGVREKIALIGVRTAELELARQRLDDTIVAAPFGGVVKLRHVAPGTYVQVGQPVVTLVRTNPLYFRGMLPEREARRLAIGQTVRLRIESVPAPREATVTRISPTLDERTRALLFEAELDNSDGRLRAGWFAEAEVVVDPAAEAIVVPDSSVVEFAGVEKVWKLVDGMSQEQVVLTGGRRQNGIEIIDGLAPGDQILVDGSEGRVARVEAVESSRIEHTVARPVVEDGEEEPDAAGERAESTEPISGDAAGGE